ncbi:hypothetical protein LCGC14_0228820 [marine sediment metagenome]|uniref:Uncharacterized protein n=1 Tax=marine sediment metagenome TaxID=412755 RepID=A0A0F9XFC3_9ZZZZ
MNTDIPYVFDAHVQPDERLQDAILYYHLDRALEGRLLPCSFLNAPPSGGVWGMDRSGLLHGRREMTQAAYANVDVLAAVGGCIIPAALVAQKIATSPDQGMTIRNLKDPLGSLRHMQPGDDSTAHLRSIGVTRDDPVVIHPDFDLRHLRRFMVVAGKITCESPMMFQIDLANTPGDDFHDLQVDASGNHFIDGDVAWRDKQHAAAEALLSAYPLPCGAIDVGLHEDEGEIRARIDCVISAPPGGLFPYMADMARHAAKIAEYVDELAPVRLDEMAP